MIRQSLTSISSIAAIGADMIIDVRSPSEFAEDHIPGAVNLPVLSDAERAEVGTIYVQDSAFRARKVGAALVAANAAQHLQGELAEMKGDWQPLVYCWRGGQRSGAFATILDQVGWRVHFLEGGYRSYRRHVSAALYNAPLQHRIMLLDGGTGTAKTALLQHLNDVGAQTLDLEGLAAHRGSLFGATTIDQPSQKMFESRLASSLEALDPARLTWVEGESSKIGARIIPPALWESMRAAPRIEISAPLSARAAFLAKAYSDLTDNATALIRKIEHLRAYHSSATIGEWQMLARSGDWQTLAEQLMSQHYDPRYLKSQARAEQKPHLLSLKDLDTDTLAETARDLHARFN
ncbi:tRNA 2-selenouridine(34) synthase MnmH [Sulfitobacter sp. S223]|uniref:tRNA 2-selenouridine(34) synthase MnmH n=1 Tax=Sulfitobacter sp. S223 TaxID=2867023 RepID=UPI0021A41734|nr:tRNA 2-selenouridine(34) synthase MnmH [Sulfitobacter sp. S223]UWR26047.1 tRNA 2-selenouridine(34) synthase MnmH [Sulfitobacter sp. S223]